MSQIEYFEEHYDEAEEFTELAFIPANDQGYNPYDPSERLVFPFRERKFGKAIKITKKVEEGVERKRVLVGKVEDLDDKYCHYDPKKMGCFPSKKGDEYEPLGTYKPKETKHRIGVDWSVKELTTPGDDTGFTVVGKLGMDGNPLEIHSQGKTRTCPECDCEVAIKEMKRGDVFCPECGYVHNKVNTYKAGQQDYNEWNGIITAEENNVNNELNMGNENPLLGDD